MDRARSKIGTTPPKAAAGRLVALFAAFLAAMTLTVSIPQHVTDLDDDSEGPVAVMTLAHAGAQTVLDHHDASHVCADHCAAHVLSQAPVYAAIHTVLSVPAHWQGSATPRGAPVASTPPLPPPRA